MRKLIFICIIIVVYSKVYGQSVKGKIVNATTNEAIPFVTVYYNQTLVGTTANKDGVFTIQKFKNEPMPLVFSAVGFYSTVLTNYLEKDFIQVSLKPKVLAIEEVTIHSKSLERSRRSYLKIFKREFIGTTSNAKHCKIVNENDITFNYQPNSDTLIAYALKPIIIENEALGYTITYYLNNFEYSKKTDYTYFSGNFNFSKDWALDENFVTSYHTKRANTYYGSRTHFIRTLYTKKLFGSGYKLKDQWGYNLKLSKLVLVNNKQQHFFNTEINKVYIDYKGHLSNIYLSGNKVYFNETGYYIDQGISWSGDMANQRMADWLPYEYHPSKD